MSSYICENCGCIDNSACGGNYWSVKGKLQSFASEEANTKLLCVECTPSTYKDGSKNDGAGKWHNRFNKTHWTDFHESKDKIRIIQIMTLYESEDRGDFVNATDYFKKYHLDLYKESLGIK